MQESTKRLSLDKIKERLKQCDKLPTLPAVAAELLNQFREPEVNLRKAAALIERDPALTASVLRFVNSPYWGIRNEIRTISHAIALLGVNAVHTLALSFSLVRGLRDNDHGGFNFNRYWKRSLFCAAATRAFGSSKGILELENLFLAGLLQDIGMLAIQALASKDYGAISETAGDDHFRLIELEQKIIGADHSQIGLWLAEQWGLPEAYRVAIVASHNSVQEDLSPEFQEEAECVFLSSCLAEIWLNKTESSNARAWQHLAGRTNEEALETITASVEEWFSDLSDLFQIPVEDSERASEILLEAREQLAELSLENLHRARQVDQERDRLAARNLELRKRSYQDSLTGLYNRAYFDDALLERFQKDADQGKISSVIFCDVDDFKKFNDEYGHKCGDEVLSSVGRVIQQEIRLSDFAIRFGGDEFVVLLPGAARDLTIRIARRIIEAVAHAPIRSESGSSMLVTISAGCATHDPETPFESLPSLCEAADCELSRVKRDRRKENVKS
jgi:diguanylate cyclase (GGDEF)-like protein